MDDCVEVLVVLVVFIVVTLMSAKYGGLVV